MRGFANISTVLALSLFLSSISAQDAVANGSANRCIELFQSSSKSIAFDHDTSRVDQAWQILTSDHGGKGDWDLLARALPVAQNMSARERLEFAERCVSRPEGQTHLVGKFLLQDLLKTRNEDPIRGLTGTQLFPIFKKLGPQALAVLADQHKRYFPLFSKKQLGELAGFYSERHPVVMGTHGDVFPMTEKQKTQVFLSNAKNNGRSILKESRYGIDPDRNAAFRKYGFFPIDLPRSAEKKVLRTAFANDGLQALMLGALKGIRRIDDKTPLEAPPGQPSIRSTVETVAGMYPDLIHPSEAKILWDRVKDIEVGFRILEETSKLTDRGIPIPRSSLEVLGLALGYEAHAVDEAKLSERQTKQLYELSLDLSSQLERPPFDGVTIDPAIWQPKNVKEYLDLLGSLRDLTHLYGNNQRAWERVLNEIGIKRGLHPQLLTELKSRARSSVIAALKDAFKGTSITIGQKELDSLYERWGTVEPIITLVARFQGNERWRAEVPVLAKILQSVLDDRFSNFKYEGDPADSSDRQKARTQLQALATEQARVAWKKNRSKVDLYDPTTSDSESDASRVARAHTIVTSNLNANLLGRTQGPTLDGQAREALMTQIIQNRNSPSPNELMKALKTDATTLERTLLRSLTELSDANSIRKVASFLRGNAATFGYQAQTVADLSAIVSTVVPAKKSDPTIIFTTTFDNPKLLITIGDLVDTSSCQNYKTGSHIETLPGYVMDAGVKGIVSYAIKAGHFAQHSEFNALIEALQTKTNGENIEIKGGLDADKGIVHFRISQPGQQEVQLKTVALSKAQLRVVLKLGQTSAGKPGIMDERPYEQTHAARALMMSHVNQLKKETANAIGGVTDQEISIPESRNSGGVYSDAARGVQTGPYQIRPQTSRDLELQ